MTYQDKYVTAYKNMPFYEKVIDNLSKNRYSTSEVNQYILQKRGYYMTITVQKEFENIEKDVTKKIDKYIEEYNLSVEQNAKENLAIHLALSITRELSGNYIQTSHSQLESCKDLPTYPIAKKLVKELADDYNTGASELDFYTAAMYLSNLDQWDLEFNSTFDIIDDEMGSIMDEALDEIKDKLGVDLKLNDTFYKGMTLHFYPALERLEHNNQLMDNPLVDMVSASHEKEYQCAEILNNIVKKHYNKDFNENELGYITLHFGTAFYSSESH